MGERKRKNERKLTHALASIPQIKIKIKRENKIKEKNAEKKKTYNDNR